VARNRQRLSLGDYIEQLGPSLLGLVFLILLALLFIGHSATGTP
jgi:hypothetical protein